MQRNLIDSSNIVIVRHKASIVHSNWLECYIFNFISSQGNTLTYTFIFEIYTVKCKSKRYVQVVLGSIKEIGKFAFKILELHWPLNYFSKITDWNTKEYTLALFKLRSWSYFLFIRIMKRMPKDLIDSCNIGNIRYDTGEVYSNS